MKERERPTSEAGQPIDEVDHGGHVIEPDTELGQAMTRAREQWIAADPAETVGADEKALREAMTE